MSFILLDENQLDQCGLDGEALDPRAYERGRVNLLPLDYSLTEKARERISPGPSGRIAALIF